VLVVWVLVGVGVGRGGGMLDFLRPVAVVAVELAGVGMGGRMWPSHVQCMPHCPLLPSPPPLRHDAPPVLPPGMAPVEDVSIVTEGSRAEASEVFFEKSTLVQPPLTETIKLAPGVVLKEGGSVLEGPKADAKVAGRMSRGDFMVRARPLPPPPRHPLLCPPWSVCASAVAPVVALPDGPSSPGIQCLPLHAWVPHGRCAVLAAGDSLSAPPGIRPVLPPAVHVCVCVSESWLWSVHAGG
jgi:hypothetical protein